MRRRLLAVVAVCTYFGYASVSSAAPTVPSVSRDEVRGLRPTLRTLTGAPWVYSGRMTIPGHVGARPEARARFALRVVKPAVDHLEMIETAVHVSSGGSKIVRFGQMHRGLPVLGGSAAVRLDGQGNAIRVSSSLVEDLPASVNPTVPEAAAADKARERTGSPAGPGHLVVVPTREGARLAWAFLSVVPLGIPSAPRALIDAHTGDVLQVRDTIVAAQRMKMYATNPVASPNLEWLPLPMASTGAGGVLANDFLKTANCAGDGVIKSFEFSGFPVKMRACELVQSALPNAEGDYDLTPIDDPAKRKESGSDDFSEGSMYYHATRIYEYFRRLQGDPNAQVVVEKPLSAVSNLRIDSALLSGNLQGLPGPELVPMSNAFYAPAAGGMGDIFGQVYGISDGGMWFFQGPRRDYSYDGDVVYHEFVHAVVNATMGLGQWSQDKFGVAAEPGAMNEGIADYFSAALGNQPDVGEYASQDISASMKAIRTLANNDRCPTEMAGEVHYDSTLFSGALWDARASLKDDDAKRAFDGAIYEAMRTASGVADATFETVAKLFIDEVRNASTTAADALEGAFTARGVLPECSRIFDYADKPLSPPRESGIPGFVSPGKQGLVGVKDLAPGVMQVRTKLPERASKLTVSFATPKLRGRMPGGEGAGGAGGPFGGGGKPFEPVVLVKWGDAVTWSVKGKLKVDADVRSEPEVDGNTYSVSVEVPEGATVAAVQVANAGDQDGFYGQFAISVEQAPPVKPTGGETPSDPSVPAPGTGNGGAPSEEASDSGCGCSVPRSAGSTGGWLAGIAAVAAVIVRRRRK